MKTTKFASVAFALLLSFGIHFLISCDFYSNPIFFKRYFFKSVFTTGFYFIISLVAFGFFILEPYKKQEEEISNTKILINWPWHIYLSIWLLLFISLIELSLWQFIPDKITQTNILYSSVIFTCKGILLIPTHFKNQKRENPFDQLWLAPLFLLELILFLASVCFFYMLSDVTPEFGE